MAGEPTDGDPYVVQALQRGVQWLTLNRPEQRNPLSAAMIAALHSALNDAVADPAVRVIVLTASGPVFSAGHNLNEMSRSPDESAESHRQRLRSVLGDCSAMMLAIMQSPKPVIACVQGTATAAGCQLVSACDLAIASNTAHFCTPGVNIGNFCTTPLVGIGRNLHRKHAMELALTGDMFSAEDAVRFGLLNRVVEPAELLDATRALAEQLCSKSAEGIASGKAAFYKQLDMPVEEAFAYATEVMVAGMSAPEAVEGANAFLEKRPPSWRDATDTK